MKYLTGIIALFVVITARPAQGQPIAGNGVWSAPDTALVQGYQPQTASKQSSQPRSYSVPFASRGNTIKLAVANTASQALSGLQVRVEGIPEWLQINPQVFTVGELSAGAEITASFTFHLTKQAPVGKTAHLSFTATDGQEFSRGKAIELKVAAPTAFRITPNYPNPFSGATKMDLTLPAAMQVNVTVYDVLGRKVETVLDTQMPAGGDTMEWNPAGTATGIYFCVMKAKNIETGQQITEIVKMMLVK